MNPAGDGANLNRIVAYTLALGLALALARPPRQVPALELQQTGRLERIGGICVVYVQGDPYQMGLQQGVLLRSELRSLIRDYLYGRLIVGYQLSQFWLLYQARLLDRPIPDPLRQEMQGIADGAGLSYQDVLLLNTVPDLQALTRRVPSWDLFPALFSSASQAVPSARSSLCAAFAGWGRATADGELLVGHDLDCAESDLLRRSLAVTIRHPSKGDSFVALGLVGTVGVWTGMNEEKVIVALSSSPSADVAVSGQPLPLLLRQVLESSGSLTEAVDLLLSAERLYGGNVILGDGKAPQGVVLELSAHEHALFEADAASDLLLRTNHFLDTELASAQRLVLSAGELASSDTRMERLQGVLESNQGWIGTDKALAFLEGMDDVPSGGIEGIGTLQTVLLNPARFTLWIAQGNPSAATTASYIRLNFASELLGGH
jgi:hypothetical protein